MGFQMLRKLGEDVVASHDEQLLVLHLDFSSGELGVDDLVAGRYFHLDAYTATQDTSRPNGDYLALLGPLPGHVGQDDPADGHLFLLAGADQCNRWLVV